MFRWMCKNTVTVGDTAVRAATTSPEAGVVVLRNSKTGKCLTRVRKPESTTVVQVVQEHCRFDDSHKPNDEDQWFHVLQAAPFTNAVDGPTTAGYFYVVPANINPAKEDSWKKSEKEVEAAGSRCLYVDSLLTRDEVHEGRCMIRGARSSLRMFRLVNTSAVDEYGIRSAWGACWQPRELARMTLRQQLMEWL